MSANVPFSQEYLKSILDYNPDTGLFQWKWRSDVRPNWNKRWAGKITGCPNKKGYLRIVINSKLYFCHVLAWFYITGEWCLVGVDHKNEIKNDNSFG